MKLFDGHLGRQETDVPVVEHASKANRTNSSVVLNNDTRLLEEVTLQSGKEVELTEEELESIYFSKIHTIYSRFVSILHLIGEAMQYRLLTNDGMESIRSEMFIIDYQRLTYEQLDSKLVKMQHNKSYSSGHVKQQQVFDIHESVEDNGTNDNDMDNTATNSTNTNSTAPTTNSTNASANSTTVEEELEDENEIWITLEDAMLTGSKDQTQYQSSLKNVEKQISKDEDLLFNPELQKLMWENRDYFTRMPEQQDLSRFSLYILTLVQLPFNPYYWHPSVFNYSNRTTYHLNQSYFSPSLTQLTFDSSAAVLNPSEFTISFDFQKPDPVANYSCVQIIANWTNHNCSILDDNLTITCNCYYITDLTLLQQFVPEDNYIDTTPRVKLRQVYKYFIG